MCYKICTQTAIKAIRKHELKLSECHKCIKTFVYSLPTSRTPNIMFPGWRLGPLRGECWQTTFNVTWETHMLMEKHCVYLTYDTRKAFTKHRGQQATWEIWQINGKIIISWKSATPHQKCRTPKQAVRLLAVSAFVFWRCCLAEKNALKYLLNSNVNIKLIVTLLDNLFADHEK